MSAAAFFVALAAVSGRGAIAAADRRLLSVAGGHRVRWLSVFARWCTHLGSAPVVLGAAAVTIVLCLILKRATEVVLIALSISITAGAVRIVKEIVGRPGPHPRAVVWAAAGLLGLAVGWSRVYVRVHWPAERRRRSIRRGARRDATALPKTGV